MAGWLAHRARLVERESVLRGGVALLSTARLTMAGCAAVEAWGKVGHQRRPEPEEREYTTAFSTTRNVAEKVLYIQVR